MPPGLKQWPPWACCVCRSASKIAWMQYLSVMVASQVSVWAWQASRRDTVSHVTSAAASSSSSSLFDVKECTEIAFQSVHAHCMCTVSMCNPCCHSDRNPPMSPWPVRQVQDVSSPRVWKGVMKRPCRLAREEKQMCEQAAHLDGKINKQQYPITPWTFGPYKDATLKSTFMTPVIGH